MDTHKLEIFVDLSETLNYTETAERQFTTQGTISKQIISLEKDLSVKLFTRSNRKIALTEAGELALPYAKEVLAKYQAFTNALADYQTLQNLALSIYTIPTMANYKGLKKITDFLKIHPEVTLHLQESESNELFARLAEGKGNLIFARIFAPVSSELEAIEIESDHFVAVLPRTHPLANEAVIDLIQLQEDAFLTLKKDSNLFDPFIELCREAGFEPTIIYEGARIDLIMNMVASELGIAIVMEKTITTLTNQQTVIVPLKTNKDSQLAFIRRKGENTQASDIFWHYLTKQQ